MRSGFLKKSATAIFGVLFSTAANAAVIYMDFGTENSGSPWNDISGGTAIPLLDTAGNGTGISATQSGFSGGSNSGGGTGMTGAAATAFGGGTNVNAAKDYSFAGSGTTANVAFTGLSNNNRYTFTVYGARNNGNTSLYSTYTAIGANTSSGSLQTYRDTGVNNDQVVVLSNIIPNASNRIDLTMYNASGFSYINAVRVDVTAVPEPATAGFVLAGAGLFLAARRRR